MQIRNLSVLAYANGFTLWHYKAFNTLLAQVSALDYFSDAEDMLTTGDLILVSASDGASIRVVGLCAMGTVATVPLS